MADDSEILAAMARCLASYGAHLARSMGGEVSEHEGFVLCNSGLTSTWRNMVVPLRELASVEAKELADLVTRFYDDPSWCVLWSIPDQPHLPTAGFARYPSSNPAMTLAGSTLASAGRPEGFEIEEVSDDGGVRLFEQLRQEAYGEVLPDDPAPGQYFDARVLSSSHRLWVGRLHGRPVATGALFEADGVSLVKNIAVTPAARRQGLGKAMSVLVTAMASTVPVLDANDEAPKLYAALGFRVVGDVRFWRLR